MSDSFEMLEANFFMGRMLPTEMTKFISIIKCKTQKAPIWFDEIEKVEFGISELEVLKLKSEIELNKNITGRSELDEILEDWRLPRNQNGEPAHIPKLGITDINFNQVGLDSRPPV